MQMGSGLRCSVFARKQLILLHIAASKVVMRKPTESAGESARERRTKAWPPNSVLSALRDSRCLAVLLEKGVHLESCLESEQAPDLTLRQRTGAIALYGKRFERVPEKIRPAAFERRQNVISKCEDRRSDGLFRFSYFGFVPRHQSSIDRSAQCGSVNRIVLDRLWRNLEISAKVLQ